MECQFSCPSGHGLVGQVEAGSGPWAGYHVSPHLLFLCTEEAGDNGLPSTALCDDSEGQGSGTSRAVWGL